jgi:hypothetical protein
VAFRVHRLVHPELVIASRLRKIQRVSGSPANLLGVRAAVKT